MPVLHRTGSVFDAPSMTVLVHSCNALGLWGAGVAKEIGDRFPDAKGDYTWWCRDCTSKGEDTLGRARYFPTRMEGKLGIASLIVSRGVGRYKDPPASILLNTRIALHGLLGAMGGAGRHSPEFHSPRLNAGLFGVPWEDTEAVLQQVVKQYGVTWVVWTP